MAYTALYTASDIGAIAIDIVGAFMNWFVANVNLILVVVLLLPLASLALARIFGLIKF